MPVIESFNRGDVHPTKESGTGLLGKREPVTIKHWWTGDAAIRDLGGHRFSFTRQ